MTDAEAVAHDYDQALSPVCKCGHTLGDHDWPADRCLSCGCQSFDLWDEGNKHEQRVRAAHPEQRPVLTVRPVPGVRDRHGLVP